MGIPGLARLTSPAHSGQRTVLAVARFPSRRFHRRRVDPGVSWVRPGVSGPGVAGFRLSRIRPGSGAGIAPPAGCPAARKPRRPGEPMCRPARRNARLPGTHHARSPRRLARGSSAGSRRRTAIATSHGQPGPRPLARVPWRPPRRSSCPGQPGPGSREHRQGLAARRHPASCLGTSGQRPAVPREPGPCHRRFREKGLCHRSPQRPAVPREPGPCHRRFREKGLCHRSPQRPAVPRGLRASRPRPPARPGRKRHQNRKTGRRAR
jgi:hypothetical protein